MTELVIPEVEPLVKEHSGLLARSQGISVICDADTYLVATDCKMGLSARRMWLDEFFARMKRPIDAAKKAVLDNEHLVSDAIKIEEKRIGALLVAYDDEQERQRLIAQKKAQEDAQLAEAALHEQLGDSQAADEALNGNGLAQVKIEKATPKVDGISYRENWGAEVVNMMALIKAVAEGKASPAFLQPNQVALNLAAKAHKADFSIPGVKAVMTKTAVGRH